jgi:hypothetical protein
VECPFRILKRVFKYTKATYRGLKKNREWLLTAFTEGKRGRAIRIDP